MGPKKKMTLSTTSKKLLTPKPNVMSLEIDSDIESQTLPGFPNDSAYENFVKNFKISTQDKNEACSSKGFQEDQISQQKSAKSNSRWNTRKKNTKTQLEISTQENNILEEVNELKKTVIFISEKFDKIERKNKEIFQLLKTIKKEKENLRKENETLKKELTKYNKEVNFFIKKTDKEDQNKIMNNIEIIGIPKQNSISDETLTRNIFSKIGATFKAVKKIERMDIHKNKDISSTIKICMETREAKDTIIKKSKFYYRNKGKLTTNDLNIKGPPSNIYINEELTKRNKYLLGKTRELRKHNFKFVWYKNGNIFARKTEEDEPILIKNIEHVTELLQYG